MINAKELRIGNLINDFQNTPRTVAYVGETIGIDNDIGGTDKYQYNPVFSLDIRDLNYIPLTEEWLVKFGFNRQGKRDMWIKDKLCLNIVDGLFYLGIKDMSNTFFHLTTNIQYIHQLQNLYFVLTGNELTIK